MIIDLIQKTQILQTLLRLPLTVNQRAVLLMVYDRTLGWNKQEETISIAQFQKGVHDRTGKCWNPGLGLSHPTIIKAARELVEMGLLLRRQIAERATAIWSLNIKRLGDLLKMAIPKRFRGEQGDQKARRESFTEEPEQGFSGGPEDEFDREKGAKSLLKSRNSLLKSEQGASKASFIQEYPREEKEKSEENTYSGPGGTGETPALEKPLGAQADAGAKSGPLDSPSRWVSPASANSAPPRKMTFRQKLETIWESSWRENSPDAPLVALKPLDLNMLKGVSRTFKSPEEFLDYFEWTCRNWIFIRTQVLGFLSNVEPFPAVRLIISAKIRPAIVAAWQQRVETERRWHLDERERGILQIMRTYGLSREGAEKRWDQQDGFLKARRKLEEDSKILGVREQALRRREKVREQVEAASEAPKQELVSDAEAIEFLSTLSPTFAPWES